MAVMPGPSCAVLEDMLREGTLGSTSSMACKAPSLHCKAGLHYWLTMTGCQLLQKKAWQFNLGPAACDRLTLCPAGRSHCSVTAYSSPAALDCSWVIISDAPTCWAPL